MDNFLEPSLDEVSGGDYNIVYKRVSISLFYLLLMSLKTFRN